MRYIFRGLSFFEILGGDYTLGGLYLLGGTWYFLAHKLETINFFISLYLHFTNI